MKFLVMLLSVSAFANDVTDRSIETKDISAKFLVESYCKKTGNFNPFACMDSVNKCMQKNLLSKTVTVGLKLQVLDACMEKFQ